MELKKLTLTNFKNLGQASLEFSPAVNCFLGNNGMGKSNLLDAIFVLSFCRSFSGVNDSMLITRGETLSMIRGEYSRCDTPETLSLALEISDFFAIQGLIKASLSVTFMYFFT